MLVTRHLLDSLALALLAGLLAAVLHPAVLRAGEPLIARLAELGYWTVLATVAATALGMGIAKPALAWSWVQSIRAFPRHVGLWFKVGAGVVAWWLVAGGSPHPGGLLLLAIAIVGGAAAGVAISTLRKRCAEHERPSASEWPPDDGPVKDEDESRVPEHADVAARLLNRLGLETDSASVHPPTLALIGSYGSGKTSICHLVEGRYRREKRDRQLAPTCFCWFEAWQYTTPEAAVGGLVETATRTILARCDAPELWRLPQAYAASIHEVGGKWLRAALPLVSGCRSPDGSLRAIGSVLERLGWRLVIFIDDLDRIEAEGRAVQQAIIRALNVLQGVPRVQYVVAVGSAQAHGADGAPALLDLLKLTRFQELVPTLAPSWVMQQLRDDRDCAKGDDTIVCPWARRKPRSLDPLGSPQWPHYKEAQPVAAVLAELIDTPRVLKSVLRETRAIWDGPLRGELNWYDLLLISALKAAEPRTYEWILRDWGLFVHGRAPSIPQADASKKEADAAEMMTHVRGTLQRSTLQRQEAVAKALCLLFPEFASGYSLPWADLRCRELPLDQGLGTSPWTGRSYLERFASGQLDPSDVPDQPTLRFTRHAMDQDIDPEAVRSMFLDSLEKLGGPLEKLVQFGHLLSLEKAMAICDVILDWMADPRRTRAWCAELPELVSYYDPSMYHLGEVVKAAGRQAGTKNAADTVARWLEQVIDRYSQSAWQIPGTLLARLALGAFDACGIKEAEAQALARRLAGALRRDYIDGNRPLLEAIGQDLFSVYGFVQCLRADAEEYAAIRRQLTERLLDQADQDQTHRLKQSVVICLVQTAHRGTGDPEPPLEAYRFPVDGKENDRALELALVIPALRRWASVELPDPRARKAFAAVRQHYGIGDDASAAGAGSAAVAAGADAHGGRAE